MLPRRHGHNFSATTTSTCRGTNKPTPDPNVVSTDPEVAGDVLRLDDKHPRRPDDDVVDVGSRQRDLPVMKDDEAWSSPRAVARAGVSPGSEAALDAPLGPSGLPNELGPATGRSGAYPGGTRTHRTGPTFRTHRGDESTRAVSPRPAPRPSQSGSLVHGPSWCSAGYAVSPSTNEVVAVRLPFLPVGRGLSSRYFWDPGVPLGALDAMSVGAPPGPHGVGPHDSA
jgi:hypothetical protein